jgi:hypothetical protein
MSETAVAGATVDLIQPPTTEADKARAQIAELKANPEWVKRHLGGDHTTRAELARLHEIAFTPEPGSITMGGPTPEAQRAEMADHLGNLFDVSTAVLDEIRQGKPASVEDHRLAVGRKNALMTDPSWVTKYMNGDASARREMWLLNSILSRR